MVGHWWVGAALVTAALWGMTAVLDKLVVSVYYPAPQRISQLSALLAAAAGILLWAAGGPLLLEQRAAGTLLLAALSGFLFVCSAYLYMAGLSRGDVSTLIIVIQGIPALTALWEVIFLGTRFFAANLAGIALVTAGAAAVSVRRRTGSRPSGPTWRLFVVVAAVGFSISWVLTKGALNDLTLRQFFVVSRLGGLLGLPAIELLHRLVGRPGPLQRPGRPSRRALFALLFGQTISVAGIFTSSAAFSGGAAALVAALLATEPLILLTYLYLWSRLGLPAIPDQQEISLRRKLWGAALMIGGAYLVTR